jgi:hypothetical protein
MAHRRARSTRAGGRPKSGEGDLGLPVKFYRVRGLGKLHRPMANLTEVLAAMAGGKELAGAKEGWLAGDGERGVK